MAAESLAIKAVTVWFGDGEALTSEANSAREGHSKTSKSGKGFLLDTL